MSGLKLLLDTNVILYFMAGDPVLKNLFSQKELFISSISVIELLSYPGMSEEEESSIQRFIDDCHEINLTDSIRDKTILIRKLFGLKLPDALIAATALAYDLPLVSSDKVFERVKDLQWIHYRK